MDAERLREQLAARLVRDGVLRDAAVAHAVRGVPRHVFAPEVALETAYEDRVIRVKEAGGTLLSSLSQPAMIVEMLQQLDVHPGERVLEIGTGTGYTTALLATLAGPGGRVTTVEIEPDLVAVARKRFASLDLRNVDAFAGDGACGASAGAPYDRILLTVAATDIEPAWWEQLASGGRMVLPLSLGGVQKSIAFAERDGELHSDSTVDCSFLTLRGEAESAAIARLFPERGIYLQFAQSLAPDVDALARRLEAEPPLRARLEGTYAPRDFVAAAALWIALHDLRYCRLEWNVPATRPLPALYLEAGGARASVGLCERDALALLDFHDAGGERAALSIAQYGDAGHLAQRLRDLVDDWDARGRPGRSAVSVVARRSDDGRPEPAATVTLNRPHTRFYVTLA